MLESELFKFLSGKDLNDLIDTDNLEIGKSVAWSSSEESEDEEEFLVSLVIGSVVEVVGVAEVDVAVGDLAVGGVVVDGCVVTGPEPCEKKASSNVARGGTGGAGGKGRSVNTVAKGTFLLNVPMFVFLRIEDEGESGGEVEVAIEVLGGG